MDSSLGVLAELPAGSILDYAGSTPPEGFLLLDGSTISRTVYSRLFAVFGTNFGAGDGSTTFKLPDYRGKTSIGSGQGTSLTNRTIGTSVGNETHQLTEAELPNHTHVQNPHNHTVPASRLDSSGSSQGIYAYRNPGNLGSFVEQTVATNQNTGGNQSHNNMMAFIVFNKIVRI